MGARERVCACKFGRAESDTWSAKNALHTSVSAFGRYETIDKNCNSYSKDALRQGSKRTTIPLQQENETLGQVSCLEVSWKFV